MAHFIWIHFSGVEYFSCSVSWILFFVEILATFRVYPDSYCENCALNYKLTTHIVDSYVPSLNLTARGSAYAAQGI